MRAGILNLLIQQGSTFSRTLTWEIDGVPVNLAGYTAEMHINTVPTGIKVARVLETLNTENGKLIIDNTTGSVTINLSAAATSKLPAGKHVYDLELVSNDYVQRLVQGRADVLGEVTR
jgi:hypothetical protein